MTYNVRYFGHPTRGLASTGAAFSRIARSIAALDPTPDLVCLQEVETRSIRVDLHQPPLAPGGDPARLGDDRAARRARAGGEGGPLHRVLLPRARPTASPRAPTSTPPASRSSRATRSPSATTTRASPTTSPTAARQEPQADAHLRARLASRTRAASRFDVFNTHLSPAQRLLAASSGRATRRMGFAPNQLAEAGRSRTSSSASSGAPTSS